jgi:hypothetical protein
MSVENSDEEGRKEREKRARTLEKVRETVRYGMAIVRVVKDLIDLVRFVDRSL